MSPELRNQIILLITVMLTIYTIYRAIEETLLQVLNLMLEADLDGNGTIEFPEFLELMKEKYGKEDMESDLR